MKLDEFLKETLVGIVRGVEAAQKELRDTKAYVNPVEEGKRPERMAWGRAPIETVEFDVAVTVSKATKDNLKGGLVVAGIGLGGSAQDEAGNQTVSRVRFSVALAYPTDVRSKDASED